jgi:hypothetical protein
MSTKRAEEYAISLSDDLKTLLEQADEVIENSRALCAESRAVREEARLRLADYTKRMARLPVSLSKKEPATVTNRFTRDEGALHRRQHREAADAHR